MLWLGLGLASRARAEGRLVVLPIFGVCPPELSLPSAARLAEAILLELPGSDLEVEAQQPAGRPHPAGAEALARERALELEAQAAVWGELLPPGDCRAARSIGIRILDLGSDERLERILCPEGVDLDGLARAVGLAVADALQSGQVAGISIRTAPGPAPGPQCPPCPQAAPCPDCPPCPERTPCPPPPVDRRDRLVLAAGAAFSSHPTWSGWGLGLGGELAYAPLEWLEIGVGLAGMRGRRVELDAVDSLFTHWPTRLWTGARLRWGSFEALGRLGFQLAWTRLDVLLPELGSSTSIERFNPAVFGRLGLRWWSPWGFGLELCAGPSVFLRRQRYTYGYGEAEGTVLSMQAVSLEAGLRLVVGIL